MLVPRYCNMRMRGRDEVFVVSQVYPSLQLVDLVPLGRDSIIEPAVLFDNLEDIQDEADAA